jgi:glycosyltransferase involved in cell wall biosynthesis/predicted SAM-dependent methyltransferase
MKIHLHASVFFESWSYANGETGIGGSEIHQIELAWRLARRGYEVISYAPIPKDCDPKWRGTTWKHFKDADYSEPGLWVIYRNPEFLDKFGEPENRPGQTVVFMAQDEHYGDQLTPKRIAKLDKYCVLTAEHYKLMLKMHPFLKDKLWITGNYGSKTDLIREIEAEGMPERNPKKLIYTSSPDRGLMPLLWIFSRARERVPDLELHIFYGFDNIDKLIDFHPHFSQFKTFKEEAQRLMNRPGVFWHGRIGQKKLYRELMSAGLWVYPCQMFETYCISVCEAQACGAIPITRAYGGLADNTRHGILLDGDPKVDRLTQCRFAWELINLASDAEAQEAIRKEMMPDARHWFNWERAVDQWSNFIEGNGLKWFAQFQFQRRYMAGKTLNLGCGNDPLDLKAEGVVNLDVTDEWPEGFLPRKCPVDVVADAREALPFEKEFDSVILGEVLEHLSEGDGIEILKNCRKVLKPGGRLVITVPNDSGRPHENQHKSVDPQAMFHDGASAFHDRAIKQADIYRMVHAAGLFVDVYQPIDYNNYEGHGLVCSAIDDDVIHINESWTNALPK